MKLTGWWVALEIYTPETLPLRTVEALAPSSQECLEQLRERRLNLARYELSRLGPVFPK